VNVAQAVVLGVVEGLTEFLPVSSTGHLTVAERLLGLEVDDPGVTAFTAVVQVGAVVAVLLYFRRDLARLTGSGVRGLIRPAARDADFRLAWLVVAGSLPIGVVGLLARDLIEGPLRSLWVVAAALVSWSAVMFVAERRARQERAEADLTLADTLLIGTVQCLALVPGVSRSGATISTGLLRGVDRVTATRLSFLLAIPALTAAGVLQLPEALDGGVGAGATLAGVAVAFVVAYASVAWLLRLVARRPITVFIGYRVGAGTLLAVLLATGVLEAT
jgi:undecaprenyl-diphosphatase